MWDASARFRFRYADVLRAIGQHLDVHGIRDVLIVELNDGFLVRGRIIEFAAGHPSLVSHAILFTDSDLDALLEAAYQRRARSDNASSSTSVPRLPTMHLRHEDVLRVIGQYIDERDWHDIVIMQTPEGIQFKGTVPVRRTPGSAEESSMESLAEGQIQSLVDERIRRRHATARTYQRRWPWRSDAPVSAETDRRRPAALLTR